MVNEKEWLFVISASWPDWIKEFKNAGGKNGPPLDDVAKDLKAEHVEGYHFIDVPYFFPSKQAFAGHDPKEETITIVGALDKVIPDVLKNGNPANRAVHVCWLLHCTGDIHQPLHCATLFSNDYLKGDMGGNHCLVKHQGKPINLHAFWDDRLGSFTKSEGPKGAAVYYEKVYKQLLTNKEILSRDEFNREKFATRLQLPKASQWAEECHAIAVKTAYKDGTLPRHAFLTRFPTPMDNQMAPDLESVAGYADDALRVASEQAALGGYRLSDQLDRYFPSKNGNP
jgi:hypothetical protein